MSILLGETDGRAIGTLGEPNALGAYAVGSWSFLFLGKKKASYLSLIFAFILTVLIIIFSGSRSAFIALLVQLTFLGVSKFISLGKASLLSILLLLLSLALPLLDTTTVYENRAEIWSSAFIAGYEHLLIGWGFGNTEVAFKTYNHKLYNRLQGYYVDSSHNILLDFWVEGGMLGLSFFILLLFETIRGFFVKGEKGGIVLFLGLLTVLLFNPVSVVTLLQFWWVIGYSFSLKKNRGSNYSV